MQASGNLTYAELEHHTLNKKAPQRDKHRDKTSVLYSEIKLNEVSNHKHSVMCGSSPRNLYNNTGERRMYVRMNPTHIPTSPFLFGTIFFALTCMYISDQK
jgi:hypothetical protein